MLLRCCHRAVEEAAASSEIFWALSTRAEWAAAGSRVAVNNVGGSCRDCAILGEMSRKL